MEVNRIFDHGLNGFEDSNTAVGAEICTLWSMYADLSIPITFGVSKSVTEDTGLTYYFSLDSTLSLYTLVFGY